MRSRSNSSIQWNWNVHHLVISHLWNSDERPFRFFPDFPFEPYLSQLLNNWPISIKSWTVSLLANACNMSKSPAINSIFPLLWRVVQAWNNRTYLIRKRFLTNSCCLAIGQYYALGSNTKWEYRTGCLSSCNIRESNTSCTISWISWRVGIRKWHLLMYNPESAAMDLSLDSTDHSTTQTRAMLDRINANPFLC